MKVLQTLGRHSGDQEGVFQYKRYCDGVLIDASISNAKLKPSNILISHGEWADILNAIATASHETFRLTGRGPFSTPPYNSLYALLQRAVPVPTDGWKWNDSWKAYICAILEHEGSIDFYHGRLGQKHSAIICLARDA